MLDAHGGTGIFQMSPKDLRFEIGFDQVACLKLTNSGPLRWHTNCCKTPVANTLANPNQPFMGVFEAFIDSSRLTKPVDEILGPVRARVNTALSPENARPLAGRRIDLISMLMHLGPRFVGWWLRGHHRHSPFFDPESGEPLKTPVRVRYR